MRLKEKIRWGLGIGEHDFAPSPQARALFGHASQLAADPLATLRTWMHEEGDVVRLRLGFNTVHVIFHPREITYVLRDNAQNFTKATPGYRTLSVFMGNGLLTSDGELWKRQRQMIRPAFSSGRIDRYRAVIREVVDDLIEDWEQHVGAGPVDVSAEMMKVTMTVISRILFTALPDSDAAVIASAVSSLQEEANRRITAPVEIPVEVPTRANRELRKAKDAIEREIMTLVDERRRQTDPPDDVLTLLTEARDENGRPMADDQLRDEIITLFLAGHESTSHLLSWAWHALALESEVEQRLVAELEQEEPESSTYLEYVLNETLRLYPPAWSIGRAPSEDDRLGEFEVPAGTLVIIAPWATHRHPEIWHRPDRFEPERFTPERKSERPLNSFFPFGAGPHTCIGARLAIMEAKLVLGHILRRFRLVPAHRPVEAEPLITLRPRNALWMYIEERA